MLVAEHICGHMIREGVLVRVEKIKNSKILEFLFKFKICKFVELYKFSNSQILGFEARYIKGLSAVLRQMSCVPGLLCI